MTSPLRLVQGVEIWTCVLEFSLKCSADRIMIPARSLPSYSPKVSPVLSFRSVGLQGSSASGLRRPGPRLAEHMSNGFPRVFIMLKRHFTLLKELAFSKLVLFLTPASVLSALGNVKQATTPVHLVTLHVCIVLRKRSRGFGNHQFPSFHGFHRLVDSIFRGD